MSVFSVDFFALSALRKDLKCTLRSAYSAGTFSNLRTQFKAFLLYCTYFRFTPTPATLDTICLYVQFLSRTLSPPANRNYLSGVKLLNLFSGLEFPFNKNFLLSLTLHGIPRNALHTPRRVPSVTPAVLYHISKVLDFETDPLSCMLFFTFLFYILFNGTDSQYSTSVPSVLRSFASSYSEGCRNEPTWA